MPTPSTLLAQFAAQLRFDDIPTPVVRKTEDLLVDWFGSVVAGHGARPVEAITRFALATGPEHGPSEVVNARRGIISHQFRRRQPGRSRWCFYVQCGTHYCAGDQWLV